MRKYYTRPCNFYYGHYARKLIEKKKAFSLAGYPNIAFDQVEIFQRKKKQLIENQFYSIREIKKLNKKILSTIESDLKNITLKRTSILGLKFHTSVIMGALNVTPETPLMITVQDGKLTVVAADIGFSNDEIDEFFDDIRPEYNGMLENLAK